MESVGGRPIPAWDLEETLAFMDRQDIETALNSVSAPRVFVGDLILARDLARSCNEYLAQVVRERPRRFGAFAVLPLPDVEAAVEETAYALDELGLDGVGLLSSVDGRYMGHPDYQPLFEELDRRGAVVFMHPHTPEEGAVLPTRLPHSSSTGSRPRGLWPRSSSTGPWNGAPA